MTSRSSDEIRFLALDPGFAKLGWAMGTLQGVDMSLVACGVISTQKYDRPGGLLSVESNMRRCADIAKQLGDMTDSGIDLCIIEAMSLPRNASTSSKLGMVYGAIATICHREQIVLAQLSPQRIKKILCGKQNASKAEVAEAVGNVPETLWAHVRRSDRNHVTDAIAAAMAVQEEQTKLQLQSLT
jgi:Holliday junction resolvasome RuvABC endonuclease subunit